MELKNTIKTERYKPLSVAKNALQDFTKVCKKDAYHGNQAILEKHLSDLKKFGVTVTEAGGAVVPKVTPVVVAKVATRKAGTDTSDCRYKDESDCQENLTAENEASCKVPLTNPCFNKHYESYWILGLFSFFLTPYAVGLCFMYPDYEWGMCMNNSAYVFILSLFDKMPK